MAVNDFGSWLRGRGFSTAPDTRALNAPVGRGDLSRVRGSQAVSLGPGVSLLPPPPPPQAPPPPVQPQVPYPYAPPVQDPRMTGQDWRGLPLPQNLNVAYPQPTVPTEPPPDPEPPPDAPDVFDQIIGMSRQYGIELPPNYVPHDINVNNIWDHEKGIPRLVPTGGKYNLGEIDIEHHETYRRWSPKATMEHFANNPSFANEIAKEEQQQRINNGLPSSPHFNGGRNFISFMISMNNRDRHQEVIQRKMYADLQTDALQGAEWFLKSPFPEKDLGDNWVNSTYGVIQRNATMADVIFGVGALAVGFISGGLATGPALAAGFAWKEALKQGVKLAAKETAANVAANIYMNKYAKDIGTEYEFALPVAFIMNRRLGQASIKRRLLAGGGTTAAAGSLGYAFDRGVFGGDEGDFRRQGLGDMIGTFGSAMGGWKKAGDIGETVRSLRYPSEAGMPGRGAKFFHGITTGKGALPLSPADLRKIKDERSLLTKTADTMEARYKETGTWNPAVKKVADSYRKMAKDVDDIPGNFTYGELSKVEKKIEDTMRTNLGNILMVVSPGELSYRMHFDMGYLNSVAGRKLDPKTGSFTGGPVYPDIFTLSPQHRRSLDRLWDTDPTGRLVEADTQMKNIANIRHVKRIVSNINLSGGDEFVRRDGRVDSMDDLMNVWKDANSGYGTNDPVVLKEVIDTPSDEAMTEIFARTVVIRNHFDIARAAIQIFGANPTTAKSIARVAYMFDELAATGMKNETPESILRKSIKGVMEGSESGALVVPRVISSVDKGRAAYDEAFKLWKDGKGKAPDPNDPKYARLMPDDAELTVEGGFRFTERESWQTFAFVNKVHKGARTIFALNGGLMRDPHVLLHEMAHIWDDTMRNMDRKLFEALDTEMYQSFQQNTHLIQKSGSDILARGWKPGGAWTQDVAEEAAERIAAASANLVDYITGPGGLWDQEKVIGLDYFVGSGFGWLREYLRFFHRAMTSAMPLHRIKKIIETHKDPTVRSIFKLALLSSDNPVRIGRASIRGMEPKGISYEPSTRRRELRYTMPLVRREVADEWGTGRVVRLGEIEEPKPPPLTNGAAAPPITERLPEKEGRELYRELTGGELPKEIQAKHLAMLEALPDGLKRLRRQNPDPDRATIESLRFMYGDAGIRKIYPNLPKRLRDLYSEIWNADIDSAIKGGDVLDDIIEPEFLNFSLPRIKRSKKLKQDADGDWVPDYDEMTYIFDLKHHSLSEFQIVEDGVAAASHDSTVHWGDILSREWGRQGISDRIGSDFNRYQSSLDEGVMPPQAGDVYHLKIPTIGNRHTAGYSIEDGFISFRRKDGALEGGVHFNLTHDGILEIEDISLLRGWALSPLKAYGWEQRGTHAVKKFLTTYGFDAKKNKWVRANRLHPPVLKEDSFFPDIAAQLYAMFPQTRLVIGLRVTGAKGKDRAWQILDFTRGTGGVKIMDNLFDSLNPGRNSGQMVYSPNIGDSAELTMRAGKRIDKMRALNKGVWEKYEPNVHIIPDDAPHVAHDLGRMYDLYQEVAKTMPENNMSRFNWMEALQHDMVGYNLIDRVNARLSSDMAGRAIAGGDAVRTREYISEAADVIIDDIDVLREHARRTRADQPIISTRGRLAQNVVEMSGAIDEFLAPFVAGGDEYDTIRFLVSNPENRQVLRNSISRLIKAAWEGDPRFLTDPRLMNQLVSGADVSMEALLGIRRQLSRLDDAGINVRIGDKEQALTPPAFNLTEVAGRGTKPGLLEQEIDRVRNAYRPSRQMPGEGTDPRYDREIYHTSRDAEDAPEIMGREADMTGTGDGITPQQMRDRYPAIYAGVPDEDVIRLDRYVTRDAMQLTSPHPNINRRTARMEMNNELADAGLAERARGTYQAQDSGLDRYTRFLNEVDDWERSQNIGRNTLETYSLRNDESLESIIMHTPGENAVKRIVVGPVDRANILNIKEIGWGLPRRYRVINNAYKAIMEHVPFSKDSKVARTANRIEDDYDKGLISAILGPLTDFINRGMYNSKNVASSIGSEIESMIVSAFSDGSFAGARGSKSLITADGRIPHLAGVPGGPTSAPTIQDVAAKFPIYRDSGLLNDNQIAVFDRIRELLHPYDELLRNGEFINLDRGAIRPDIIQSKIPEEQGFYIPRGSSAELADISAFDSGATKEGGVALTAKDLGNTSGGRFGVSDSIGEMKSSVFLSMADGMDAGYGYVPIREAISHYVTGARRMGYQDYFTRVLTKLKMSDNETPLWWSKKRLVEHQHPELSEYVGKHRTALRRIQEGLRGSRASNARELDDLATEISLYLDDPDYTKMDALMDTVDGVLKELPASRRVLRKLALDVRKSLNRRIKDVAREERWSNTYDNASGNAKVLTVYSESVNNAHAIASRMDLETMQNLHGLNLQDKYYPEVLRAMMDNAFPLPPSKPLPLKGPGGVLSQVGTRGVGYVAGEYVARSKRIVSYWRAHNRFYSNIGATADNSAVGIQLMFQLGIDVWNSGLGVRAGYQSMKMFAGIMTGEDILRHYPSVAAIKANIQVWNPFQFPEHARLLNGRLIAMFNRKAKARNMPTTEVWAGVGGRIRGQEHEYSMPRLEKIPLISRANMAFGYTGDQARIMIWDNMLETHLRKTGLTWQEALANGDMETIATQGNRAMGWSRYRDEFDIPQLLLFAPAFFKARLDNIVASFAGLRPGAALDKRLARNQMLKYMGGITMLTVTLNDLLGNETDFNPLKPAPKDRKQPTSPLTKKIPGAPKYGWEWNPNFMVVEWEGEKYHLLGSYDSMLRMLLTAAQGDPSGFESVLGGSPRVLLDFYNQTNFFGEEISSITAKLGIEGMTPEKTLVGMSAYMMETYLPWGPTEASRMVNNMGQEIANKDPMAAAIDGTQATGEMFGLRSNPLSFTDLRDDIIEREHESGRFSSRHWDALEPYERRNATNLTGIEHPEVLDNMPIKTDRNSRQMAKSRELDEMFKRAEETVFEAWEKGTGPIAESRGGTRTPDRQAQDDWWSRYGEWRAQKRGVQFALGSEFEEEIVGRGTEKEKDALKGYYDIMDREDVAVPTAGGDTIGIMGGTFSKLFYEHMMSLDKETRDYVWRNLTVKSNFPDKFHRLFSQERGGSGNYKYVVIGNRQYKAFSSIGIQRFMQDARNRFENELEPDEEKWFRGGTIQPLRDLSDNVKELVEKVK